MKHITHNTYHGSHNKEQKDRLFHVPCSMIRDQKGVTLLLSILIAAGVTLISITVSFLAVAQIRASRAVLLSEPAIVAAETSAEQAVWLIKRGVAPTDCLNDPASTQIDGSSSGASTVRIRKCTSYGAATIDLKAGVPITIYFYDPLDINGNLCMNTNYISGQFAGCSGAALYTTITLTNKIGTVNITGSVTSLDGQSFAGNSVAVLPSGSGTINIPDPIPGSSDERLRLVVSSTQNTTVIVNTNRGVPDFPTIKADACSSKTAVSDCNQAVNDLFRRQINVQVPK